jgi:hypothetical protein
MNKLYLVVVLSLATTAGTLFSKTTDCFQPYHVRIVNQSGGEAELIRSRNISGLRKGLSNAIKNYKSKDIVVEESGASVTIEYGPEDKEKTERINFYEKTGAIPTLFLKGSNVEVRGFSQHPGQQYNVTIRNESGGKAKIINACNVSAKGDIEDGSSRDVRVHAGSTLTMSIGPKGYKKTYKIRFSTPVEGGKPTITLQQGSLFHPAITGKDIRFGSGRATQNKPRIKLGPKEQEEKVKAGACSKNMRADFHG